MRRYLPIVCFIGMGFTQVALSSQTVQSVTLDAPGWSLRRICASISKQIGQQVEPHGSCVTDVLIVHVHNVPWPTLMKKLAWVEYGKWYMDGNVLTIERDHALVQAKIKENVGALAKRLAIQFKKDANSNRASFDPNALVKELKIKVDQDSRKQPGSEPADVRQEMGVENGYIQLQIENKLPLQRGFNKIIESFPPQDLAAIPNGARVVFSNHPTSLQYRLPASASSEIEKIIANQHEFEKAASAHGIALPEFQFGQDLKSLSLNDTFVVSVRQILGIGIQAALRVFNQKGSMISESNGQFGLLGQGMSLGSASKKVSTAKLDAVDARNYKSLAQFSPLPPTPQFRQVLLHPEKFDPLAVAIEPILKAIAPKKNVVIRNDSLIMMTTGAYQFKNGDEVPLDYLSSPIVKLVADEESSPEWLAIRTNYITLLKGQSIPRSPYEDLVQGISSDGLLNFLSAMKFASATGPESFIVSMFVSPFIGALTDGQNPLLANQRTWNFYCLVGSLDAGQLAQAERKTGLDLAGLFSEQQKILKLILLDKFTHAYSNRMQVPVSLADEPTYAYAQSMPHAVLTIRSKEEPVIGFSSKYGDDLKYPKMTQYATADEIAGTMASIKYNPQVHYDFTHLTLSRQQTVTMTISFPGTTMAAIAARFVTRTHNNQVYSSYKDLPAPLNQEIETTLKKMKAR